MAQEGDLLEQVRLKIGCPYLSELRSPACRKQAAHLAGKLSAEAYSLAQWRDAVCYLTDENIPFDNAQAARAFLARWSLK